MGSRISSREGDRNFGEENKNFKRKVWGRTSSCRELYKFLLLDNFLCAGRDPRDCGGRELNHSRTHRSGEYQFWILSVEIVKNLNLNLEQSWNEIVSMFIESLMLSFSDILLIFFQNLVCR